MQHAVADYVGGCFQYLSESECKVTTIFPNLQIFDDYFRKFFIQNLGKSTQQTSLPSDFLFIAPSP